MSSVGSLNLPSTRAKPATGWQRGRLSVLELSPTPSRASRRDSIIHNQMVSPVLVWQQVGALLTEAIRPHHERTE